MNDSRREGSGLPEYVAALESAFGVPSQAGTGSAVFFERQAAGTDLQKLALEKYRHFVGDLWERFGEQAWMGPWKQVYARVDGSQGGIVAELRGLPDPGARSSAEMIVTVVEGAEEARAALSKAYDDPAVSELRIFELGDGAAISGLLVAGRRASGEATFLVFLMD